MGPPPSPQIEQDLSRQGKGSLPHKRPPTEEAQGPEILITETPPLPPGVAGATMVSSIKNYLKRTELTATPSLRKLIAC